MRVIPLRYEYHLSFSRIIFIVMRAQLFLFQLKDPFTDSHSQLHYLFDPVSCCLNHISFFNSNGTYSYCTLSKSCLYSSISELFFWRMWESKMCIHSISSSCNLSFSFLKVLWKSFSLHFSLIWSCCFLPNFNNIASFWLAKCLTNEKKQKNATTPSQETKDFEVHDPVDLVKSLLSKRFFNDKSFMDSVVASINMHIDGVVKDVHQ